MFVELEPMDDFERELRQAFERRPTPPGFKSKLMRKRRAQRSPHPAVLWQRLAASIALAAVVAAGFAWRQHEERRKGEAALRQVMIALRITNRALDNMNKQRAAHGRVNQN
jgi:hypothetical protein